VNGADRIAVAFSRVLRGAGIEVPVEATVLLARALVAVDRDDPAQVYFACRAVVVTRPEDRERYDRCFRAFFLDAAPEGAPPAPADEVVVAFDASGADEGAADSTGAADVDAPVVQVRFSRAEILRHRDFATYTAAEHDEARRLMADLRIAGARRRSRRTRPTAHARGRPDLRRTVRRALQTGGEPIARAFRAPAQRHRRVVLLCDVSGSMEPYSRALIRFLHTAVVARGRVEAFALGTRLTRVTRELSSRDPDVALATAAARVVDWSGGTRLGEGLRTFNDEWGVPGMARGAVVVIVSDGWERGDTDLLATQMARLARVAHRVVWVNPLKASPGYAPLAAGMAAALPHVDEFVEGHSLASLEALAEVVARP
jgi:uncharacterized protein with von Willebrand factor type A (vWA) domain